MSSPGAEQLAVVVVVLVDVVVAVVVAAAGTAVAGDVSLDDKLVLEGEFELEPHPARNRSAISTTGSLAARRIGMRGPFRPAMSRFSAP